MFLFYAKRYAVPRIVSELASSLLADG